LFGAAGYALLSLIVPGPEPLTDAEIESFLNETNDLNETNEIESFLNETNDLNETNLTNQTTTTGTITTPEVNGRVIEVIDGDTIDVAGVGRVRLIGIDTPERGQVGHNEATNYLRELVLNKNVRLQIDARRPRDSYGRTRAVVLIGNTNVNDELVRRGHARRV